MENGRAGYWNFIISFPSLFLIVTLFGFSGTTAAGELSVLLNGKAVHLDRQPGVRYNEKNWGLGVQYDLAPVEKKWVPFTTASGFRDSNENTSYYAGAGVLHRSEFIWSNTPMRFDVGALAFVMKRKGYRDGDPFVGVLPALSLGTPKVAVNMTYIPKVDPKMVPLLYFQIKITIGRN